MGSNSRYSVAVHILLLLDDPAGAWTTSEHVACSVNTNPVVIRRILKGLQEAGIVEGQKGAHGGYRLARPCAEVTLWEVYEAMREDGPFALHEKPDPSCRVGGHIQEHLAELYRECELSMRNVLGAQTLASLRRKVCSE